MKIHTIKISGTAIDKFSFQVDDYLPNFLCSWLSDWLKAYIENGLDSGWFLGSTLDEVDNNDPGQLSVLSLYELTLKASWVHEFLSLPEGTQVVFKSELPVVLRDFIPIQPLPGSYMASINAKK